MSFLKKWGLVEDDITDVVAQGPGEPEQQHTESDVDAQIDSTENIIADIFSQNGIASTANSIYTVRAYMEKLPEEMTTVKKQQTISGILEVSGQSVSVLMEDGENRKNILIAACDSVVSDREAEIASANADIEALKQAIEVAQSKIKHAEDIIASTKNSVSKEVDAIESLIKFCEGMVK